MNGHIFVLGEISAERARQQQLWGIQDWPDLSPTHPLTPEKATEQCEATKAATEAAFASEDGSWADIACEEWAEVVEAAAHKDVPHLREELIQLAAVCVSWIEAIDRRQQEAVA
jgi:hypothetical protein